MISSSLMAPLQRKQSSNSNNNHIATRKKCSHLQKIASSMISNATTQQQHSNNYRQIFILVLVLVTAFFLTNIIIPRNFTLSLSYVEIKSPVDFSSISGENSNIINNKKHDQNKKSLLIDSDYFLRNNENAYMDNNKVKEDNSIFKVKKEAIIVDFITATSTLQTIKDVNNSENQNNNNQNNNNEKNNYHHDQSAHQTKIKIMRSKDILKQGNPLFSLKLWRQYLHYKVYKFGIPKERKVIHFYNKQGEPCAFDGYKYTPPKLCPHDHNKCNKEDDIRKNRFPSVQERIQYYMGKWYNESPNKELFSEDNKFYKNMQNKLKDITDVMNYKQGIGRVLINPFDLSPLRLYKFFSVDWKSHKSRDRNAKNYIRDFIDFSILHNGSSTPVLLHHGDGLSHAGNSKELNRSYPVFGKVRDILAEKDNVNHWRYPSTKGCRECGLKHSNIIWPLNRRRHYSAVASVPKNDISFDEKTSVAVWRGRIEKSDLVDADLPIEISSWKQRMALVGNHINSTYVNAKFPESKTTLPSGYLGSTLHMSDMLHYKYLIAIEGNDVSSGLKWMLFSNSVTLIPEPITWESWAMEAYLKPFVHYIPIHANMTNIEEMVRWCEEHPDDVTLIAKRSTLFIYDLLFHPDSFNDEEEILTGIVKRYEEIFGQQQQ